MPGTFVLCGVGGRGGGVGEGCCNSETIKDIEIKFSGEIEITNLLICCSLICI